MKVKTVLIGAAGIAALIVAGWTWQWIQAPIQGSLQARQQIFSGPNLILRHDEFYALCAAAQTQQAQLARHQNSLSTAETTQERERIRRNIAGVAAQLDRTVNQYNSNAANSTTRNQWMPDNLPRRLNTTGDIQCAN